MLALSVSNVSKSFGTNPILDGVSFNVNRGDRIGIVGSNGAGKTTLLSIIAGELQPDSGDIYISPEESLGYLRQKNNIFAQAHVYDELLSVFSEIIEKEKRFKEISSLMAKEKDASALELLMKEYNALALELEHSHSFSYESQVKGMLTRMSFGEEYYHKEISTLSGGERTRLALAALLLKQPSLLLLDEPTNHLDAETLGWLEQFLSNYRGSLLIVSHDRYFLDKTVNRIFELENETLTAYKGNYSAYASMKKERLGYDLKHYIHQMREIERQEDMIRRLAQHKTEKLAKRAKSVQKRLDRMDRPQKPGFDRDPMSLHFKENYPSGNDVLFVRNLSMSYGKNTLFENLNLHIRKGEKVCLVGANGIGKTTFLNILTEKFPPGSGEFQYGQNVQKAYYDQQQALLHKDHTVLEEIHGDYRLYSQSQLRGFLGRFNFHGDDVYKKVEDLSGGERAKLSLLKLMLSGANFLIMDEPTNHLDIQAKEAFEDAVLDFPGTVLIVSHDRYLLSKIPERIIELTRDSFVEYPGNYEYYLEKSSANKKDAADETKPLLNHRATTMPTLKEIKAENRRKAKEEEARRQRLARDIESAEENIHRLESEVARIETELCKEEIYSNPELSYNFSKELEKAKLELDSAYNHWLELKE